ncbi:hypothetical protein BC827DRAFT_1151832 [Russula dissimulans]|nr:hypothetical protein BC827DRAFT_1151832 [Russula dissimulans]
MAGAPQPGFPLCLPMTAKCVKSMPREGGGHKPSNLDHACRKGGIWKWGAGSVGSAQMVSNAVPGAVACASKDGQGRVPSWKWGQVKDLNLGLVIPMGMGNPWGLRVRVSWVQVWVRVRYPYPYPYL